MQSSNSIDVQKTSLEQTNEYVMVRHESAEAFGAIKERWDEVKVALELFLDDEDIVVRESCIVALDAVDYWGRSTCNNTVVTIGLEKVCYDHHNGDERIVDKISFANCYFIIFSMNESKCFHSLLLFWQYPYHASHSQLFAYFSDQ